MEKTAKHIIFSGQVQGVGFRFTSQRIASRYQVTGMVRNLPDGTVELIIQGRPTEINNCIKDIQNTLKDYIQSKREEDIEPSDEYTDFRILFRQG